MNKYYKAYEKRYKQMYELKGLWEVSDRTPEVINTILKYNINKNDKILELGCGEGRDAFYLLDNGYNLLAVDYSKTVINKCNELTNNKYVNNFRQFDLIEDKLNDKFDFIYSVAVIHMFVEENHRDAFYKFIREHLKDDSIALIISMGDGDTEFKTDINKAFDDTMRKNVNSGMEVMVATTSCRVKNLLNMRKEIIKNELKILDEKIIDDVPNFDKCISFIVKK